MTLRSWISAVFILSLPLCACGAAGARAEERIDPSDPTAVHAYVALSPEYRSMPHGGSVSGARFDYNKDFADGRVLTDIELPVLTAHTPGRGSAVGLGDIRAKAFYLPYVSPTGTFQAFAINLDLTAPTGDSDRGLGTGTWVFMPALVAKVELQKNLNWYPFLRGLLSTRGNPMPVRQFQSENPLVFDQMDQGYWMVANPIFTHDFAPQPGARDYRVDLKLQVGKMFTDRFGAALEGMKFLAGQVEADYHVKLMTFYYF
jgi:hypothetical protein